MSTTLFFFFFFLLHRSIYFLTKYLFIQNECGFETRQCKVVSRGQIVRKPSKTFVFLKQICSNDIWLSIGKFIRGRTFQKIRQAFPHLLTNVG